MLLLPLLLLLTLLILPCIPSVTTATPPAPSCTGTPASVTLCTQATTAHLLLLLPTICTNVTHRQAAAGPAWKQNTDGQTELRINNIRTTDDFL